MLLDELQFPVAYLNGWAYFLERGLRYTGAYFGGPSDITFVDKRNNAVQLHHILTLTPSVIPELQEYFVHDLPLFYGMRYDGCELTYRIPESSICKIVKLSPRDPMPHWPYPNYPLLLPYLPLSLARRVRCESKDFAELTHQGVEIKAKTMVIIVPPIFNLGVSMWGPMGDGEGVQMVFECDLKRKTIKASNQCT